MLLKNFNYPKLYNWTYLSSSFYHILEVILTQVGKMVYVFNPRIPILPLFEFKQLEFSVMPWPINKAEGKSIKTDEVNLTSLFFFFV